MERVGGNPARKGTAGEAGAAAWPVRAAETACRKISMVRPKGDQRCSGPRGWWRCPLVALSVGENDAIARVQGKGPAQLGKEVHGGAIGPQDRRSVAAGSWSKKFAPLV